MKPSITLSLLALSVLLAGGGASSPVEAAGKRITLPPGSVTPPPTVVKPDIRYHRFPLDTPRTRDASNSPGGVAVDVVRKRRW